MEEESQIPPEGNVDPGETRCPYCDSVVPEEARRCLMCGKELGGHERADSVVESKPRATSPFTSKSISVRSPLAATNLTVRSIAVGILIAVTVVLTIVFSFLMLRGQDSQVILALEPTFTPLPLPPSLTPTWTPAATETPLATVTPVPTQTPLPTDTPRPPRSHSVASGETLFGLSLFYRVSTDSIAEANTIPPDAQIQVGQELNIPWPTATPPLESMVLDIGGETVVADVTDCEIITIQEGDSAYGLSAQRGVPAEAIVAVNRLTEESIQLLHPGDTLCIPRMVPGDTLPATPGPQPTVTSTAFPAGPTLLYPTNGDEIDPPDGLLRLQWVSVKDLAEVEHYMVEMTDLTAINALPYRAFTRDTSLVVPPEWRPDEPEVHEFRWRVSIVNEVGQRADGQLIYTYGGESSEDSYFTWLGAVLTPTPTATSTPLPTVESGP